MKNLLIGILGMTSVVFTSCFSNKPTDPKDVARSFLTAMNKADYEAAKNYATDDTKKLLDMTSSFQANLQDSVITQSSAKKIDIVGEPVFDGDNAKITYKESDSPEPRTLNLVKSNGKWLVQQTKDNPDAGTPAPSEQ
jgi:hypothetical protein